MKNNKKIQLPIVQRIDREEISCKVIDVEKLLKEIQKDDNRSKNEK